MTGWTYIIPIIALLLSVLLLWREIRRPQKGRLAARVIATVIVVVSLVWLAFPAITERQVPAKSATASKPEDGIIDCYWPLQISSGESLTLDGVFRKTSEKPVKLLLSGFDTDMDSVTLDGTGNLPFRLQAVPGHKGRAVYRIKVIRGDDEQMSEPVPLIVQEPVPLKILLLSSSPDFEDRFLADWLGQHGYPVAARSRVSRDQYVTRFLNLPEKPLDIATFDVVIADKDAMTGGEKVQADRRVRQEGLGLLLKTDSAGHRAGSVKLQLLGSHASLAALPQDPLAVVRDKNALPLAKDSAGRVYTVVNLQGQGRVVHTSLHHTYSWLLNGQEKSYEQYWNLVLQHLSRSVKPAEQWRFSPFITRADEHLTVTLQSGFDEIPRILQDDVAIAPAGHPLRAGSWDGKYWPREKGWKLFRSAHSEQWLYIFGKDDWKQMPAAHVIAATDIARKQTRYEWWLIIPLLGGLAFLWIERKL
ncbi:hypothetical protein [uncultured Chitinophaga sp.]|uniref:hypothetical protein n=1 Tax=uncultured Chitinophaga sp. TaxID=339340 RepID=UPI0025E5A85D|nr:hypothetical protein [uncultured Chitinophaga sp.]